MSFTLSSDIIKLTVYIKLCKLIKLHINPLNASGNLMG